MSILSGLRIVEFSAFVAAPLAGATLASLGAEVIRIEQRGGGVDIGRWPAHDGRSLYRAGLDRGKRSVTLDLRSPRGEEIAAALATAPGPGAGIVVTNLGGHGWSSYEQLAHRRQDLIMILLAGTPDGRVAVDYTVNAGLGFPLVTGPSDGTGPVNHVLPAWDVAAGLYVALGIVAAELHRRATGEGQLVELALSDIALTIADRLGYLLEARLVDEPRPRLGNDLYGTYGRDFVTRDGRSVMVLALTPRQWANLVRTTELAVETRQIEERHGVDLRDEGSRFLHRDEISVLVGNWIRTRTLQEVTEAFDAGDVLWGPYRTFKELVEQDARAADPPPSPLRFDVAESASAGRAPVLGQDTDHVLRAVLGYGDEQLAALREEGVID